MLNLWDNELSGEIPAELGSLSNLGILYLSGNALSGEIPAELGSLSNLRELWLSGNGLSWADTAGAGQPLQPDKSGTLHTNRLELRTIPPELWLALSNLFLLYLSGNGP